MTDVVLGETYRDRVSGFVGVAIGRADYLEGAPEVLLAAHTGATGDDKSRWIKEGRLDPPEERRSGFSATPPP